MEYRAKPPRAKADFIVDGRGRVRSTPPIGRRRRVGVLTAVVTALVMAAPTGGLGELARTLSLRAAATAGDWIAARSPGKRMRAEIAKGKFVRAAPKRLARPIVRRRVVAAAPAPPKLLIPPPGQLPLVFADTPFQPVPMNFASLAPGRIEDLACLCNWRFYAPIGGGPLAFLGPGGGGVVFPPPGPGGPPPPAGGGGGMIPPAPIPEPNTWGMMILGFALLGTAWRRRRVIARLIIDAGLLRLEYRSRPA